MNNYECNRYLVEHREELTDLDCERVMALCNAESILLQKHNFMIDMAQAEAEYFGMTEEQEHDLEIMDEAFCICEEAIRSLFDKAVTEICETRRAEKERRVCNGRA